MGNPLSRRELGKSAIGAAMMTTLTEKRRSCAVIGAGVFGAWTAYHLRRIGYEVTLLDAYGPANMRASSGGESRIIRASYGKDEIYTRMAVRSLALWEEFFTRNSARSLFYKTGVLWIAKPDNPYANESRETLRKVNVKFEDLTPDKLRERYPQIQAEPGAGAIFEPNSGALMARDSVQAVVAEFVKDGGVYRHAMVRTPEARGHLTRVIVSDGEIVEADSFVFACGAWLKSVLPNVLGRRIFPTRQEVFFFGVPPGDRRFEPPQMPVWIDFGDDRGMYGFPDLETRGFKVAFDLHGEAFDPDGGNRLPSREMLNEARRYVSERFPALAKSPIVGSRVCQYENTSNGDFVLDRHPEFENVWIAGGGSGHGFKHGPAVGEYVAARISGAAEPPVQARFSFASKGIEQHRSVV